MTSIAIWDGETSLGVVPQEFNFNQFEKTQNILINTAGYHIPRLNTSNRTLLDTIGSLG